MEAGQQPVKYNGEGGSRKAPIRVGAVIALALLAGFVAWVVIDRSGNDSATTTTSTPVTTTPSVGPVVVSQKTLSALVSNVDHVVYWAGSRTGQRAEFTKTGSGKVYVRYLPKDVKAGDTRADFLIVATYPFPGAYDALKTAADGNEVKKPGGGIAVVNDANPTSVNFAFPGAEYQGEIYDPSPADALEVATSGDIQPVP